MVPEKELDEFVERMRAAAGTNLLSVILYGSAAAGDYVASHSNVNLLTVLAETSFAAIHQLTPVVAWWEKRKHRPPLLLTADEMRRSADVFSIEFLDMRRNHRLLWGEDILQTLAIPLRWHRAQLEYELREKTILLRQRLLSVSGNTEAKWQLLLESLPAFGTLFRHAAIALGDPGAGSKRQAVAALAAKLGIDAGVFARLLDVREGKAERKAANVDELFDRYLQLVDRVTLAVDTMLDPAA